ncbi:MAG: CBS domain-containing protein [Candidatus Helarchaeota archaeon]
MDKDLLNKQKDLVVRDVMNPKVETLPSDASIVTAAKRMREKQIGSIIIVDPNDLTKPIGIITERDMNNRVVAENRLPSQMTCSEIMSTPLLSISPEVTITTAMHQMAVQHIKRLVVMEDQKMVGIISQSDILEIAPSMIEVLKEMINIVDNRYKTEFIAGYCQKCENWSDMLEEIDGIFICPDCKGLNKEIEF